MTSTPGQDRHTGFREGLDAAQEPGARGRVRGRHAVARAQRAPRDGVGARALPEDRPRLRAQRPRGPRRLARGAGGRAREGDALRRDRRAGARGAALRPSGCPRRDLRVPDRRGGGDRRRPCGSSRGRRWRRGSCSARASTRGRTWTREGPPFPGRGRRRTRRERSDDEEHEEPEAPSQRRREFLAGSVATVGTLGTVGSLEARERRRARRLRRGRPGGPYNGPYEGETLQRVAFPLGGMGAGMLCLEGTGALSHVSLAPPAEHLQRALRVRGGVPRGRAEAGARRSRARCRPGRRSASRSPATGRGARPGACPASAARASSARFPFGTVSLEDDALPLKVEITGWSPFEAGDPDSSSLPFAALEYRLTNPTVAEPAPGSSPATPATSWPWRRAERAVRAVPGGFVLWARRDEGEALGGGGLLREDGRARRPGEPRLVPGRLVRRPDPRLEGRRGRRLLRPAAGLRGRRPPPGPRVFVPFSLAPGAERTITRPALVVRRAELAAGRRRPRGRRARGGAPVSSLVRGALRGDRGGRGVVADELRRPCARRRPASRTASTTRPCRPRSSRRWPPTSPSSSPRP